MKRKLGLMFAAAFAANCVAGLAQTNGAASKPADPATPPASGTGAVAPATSSAPGEVMPLVIIEDASLPDAIRNLARQANLNIQFDPKALGTNVPPTISFRWENVTAEQALQAVLDNYGLQLSQDPKTRISRVTTKDPAALEPLVSRVISLKYTNPTNVVPVVQAAFSKTPPLRSQVLADTRTGQLVVIATEKEMTIIEDVLQRLDTSPSQILIEARFMEASKNPKSAKGVNWSGTLAGNNVRFGNVSGYTLEPKAPTSTEPFFPGLKNEQLPGGGVGASPLILNTANGFGPIGYLNSDGLNAVVSFLNSDNQTETLSTPRAVALEGTPTELSFVQNVPVFEQEQGPSTASGVSPTTVKANYSVEVKGTILNEVGTKLIVTPRVYGVTNVFLDLKPELSEQGADATTTLNGQVSRAPTFIRRKIQTQALVPSGQTLVLGGLREDRNTKDLTKVPLLGDLPGLGRAFRSDIKSKQNRQLLIFVTPTILSQDDYIASPEARDFLKQKPVERPSVPDAPYDSAEPKDWTTPMP